MCRIAAFPPGFERKEAVSILQNFCKNNTDGTGSVFVKNGKFIEQKWPRSLAWVLKNTSFLNAMPHDGWTLVHLRAASHGGNFRRNTHPFIVGDRAIIHNGVWFDYELSALLLAKQGIHPRGETDTEVAANVLNLIGPRKFAEVITGGGVFMSLNRDGSLDVSKTSGDLVANKDDSGKVLLASELLFSNYMKNNDTVNGFMRFDKDGKYISHVEKKTLAQTYFSQNIIEDEDEEDDDDEFDEEDEGCETKTVKNFSKMLLKSVKIPNRVFMMSREERIAEDYPINRGWVSAQSSCAPAQGHTRYEPMAGIKPAGNGKPFDVEGSWE